ncbi:MAG TPA: aminotransferase class I/II-fold pyridoxal phosphate-dependent enzyme, partial [Methanomicrobiales archaeon]|nr:aminotransferase class I/II-fold pyridoxal phosphate-dependent enzyme [Methanomicrobiales archaeon]
MNLQPFKLERYFSRHEFSVRYLLSSSDCDGLKQSDIIAMADDETRGLWENLALGYTESLGLPQLREEIARLYMDVSPDEVIVTAPEEGIFVTMNSILSRGDHVICTFPAYQSLYEVARGIGCAVTEWPADEGNGWRFDPEFLR